MEARHFLFRATLASLVLLTSCSKFERLTGNDRVARVTVGASGHSMNSRVSTPQTGGVMVWAEKQEDGTQAAFYLPTDTATYTLNLTFGTWSFHATGWDGGGQLSGSPRCGSSVVSVNSSTTGVTIPIGFPGCATDSFFGTSAIRPLRLVTCNVDDPAYTGDSDCNGSALAGDLASFRVLLNTYDPTTAAGVPLKTPATSACVSISPPLPSSSYVDTGFYIPEGAGAGSPIDVTIQGFTDSSCGTGLVEYRFENGLADDGSDALFRNDGTSGGLNKNVMFLENGPEPAMTFSTVSPNTNISNLNGGFPLQVNGTNFDSLATVTVGGVNCPVTSHSSTQLICTAPGAYDSQGVAVTVTNHDGSNLTNSFSYSEDGFGNGIDADRVASSITISSSISNTANSGDTTMTALFGGRTLQSFKNIQNIAGNVVTLRGGFTLSDFNEHDDVLWHVSARSTGATDCDAANTLTANKFGYARITAVDTTNGTVTLDNAIATGVNNANVASTTRTAGSTFCAIQLVRVPNFDNLTLDSTGGAMFLKPPAFSLSSGYGGILAMRVAGTLTLTGGNSITLDASGLGRYGGADGGGVANGFQGDGAEGSGAQSNTSNIDGGGGGGAFMGGGGGGGVIGSGGGGASNPSSAGGSGTLMDPFSFEAAFGAGGGGGYTSGTPGGYGGGIVMLFARNVSGSTPVAFNANGTSSVASAGSAGGGGSGGTIYAQIMSGSSGVFTSSLNGGAGGAATYTGGGGGGGLSSYSFCNGSGPSMTPTYNGGTGATAGTGGTAQSHPVSPVTSFCP